MKLPVLLITAVMLSGCSRSDGEPNGPFTLSWYPRNDTDYGDTIPGFETMALCRRAGASKSMSYLIQRYGYRQSYTDLEQPPWFECSTECRPLMEGSAAVVCETITEYRGEDARLPRLDAPPLK